MRIQKTAGVYALRDVAIFGHNFAYAGNVRRSGGKTKL